MNYAEYCRHQKLDPQSGRAAISYAGEYYGNAAWPPANDVESARTIGASEAAIDVAEDLRTVDLEVSDGWTKAYAVALTEAMGNTTPFVLSDAEFAAIVGAQAKKAKP